LSRKAIVRSYPWLKFIALVLLLPAASGLADPSICDLALQKVSTDLSSALDLARQINPAVVRGDQVPDFRDLELLRNVIEKVKAGKKTALDEGKAAELETDLQLIADSVDNDPALSALRDASRDAHPSDQYKPGEYALKREYQHVLSELNRELPPSLKIPGVHIPYDARIPALLNQARTLVHAQEARFEPYISDTGFANLGEVRKALENYDETGKKLAQMLENEDVDFVMNRSEGSRWWIPRVGFQNQRITGSSGGTYNPSFRDRVEARMMGQLVSAYKTTDGQLKPVYGYLRAKPQAGFLENPVASHYGTDLYIFKKSRLHDRTTFTAGDSFQPFEYSPKNPNQPAQSWRGFFIPWNDRILIGPDVLGPMEDQHIAFIPGSPEMKGHPIEPIPPAGAPIEPKTFHTPAPPTPTFPDGLVPPQEPVFDAYPKMPAKPVHPTLPAEPLMAPLKPGQSFDEAKEAYDNLDEVKQVRAETARLKEQYDQQTAAYNSSPEVLAYQQELARIKEAGAKKLEAYQATPAYKAYQQAVTDVTTKFQQSDQYRDYQAALAKSQADWEAAKGNYQAALQRYQTSSEYQAYQGKLQEYQTAKTAFEATDAFKWFSFNRDRDAFFGYRETSLAPFKAPEMTNYVELQFWGPVSLDDVEAFEFRVNPPEGDFLKELQRRGIKILDGRQDPPVEWNP
jgi:hypothetical protein